MDLAGQSDLTDHWAGVAALSVFVLAYALVFLGERAGLRKSKPVMLGAGLIWVLIAIAERGESEAAANALRHHLLDFAEVFLFVLAAMTYINTMEEIGVFGPCASGSYHVVCRCGACSGSPVPWSSFPRRWRATLFTSAG